MCTGKYKDVSTLQKNYSEMYILALEHLVKISK